MLCKVQVAVQCNGWPWSPARIIRLAQACGGPLQVFAGPARSVEQSELANRGKEREGETVRTMEGRT